MPSQFDEAGFNADLEFIRAMIRYEIDVALFDVATARRHLLEKDPQAQYALTLFGEAEALLRATLEHEREGISVVEVGRTPHLALEFVLAPTFGACYTGDRSGPRGALRFRSASGLIRSHLHTLHGLNSTRSVPAARWLRSIEARARLFCTSQCSPFTVYRSPWLDVRLNGNGKR